MRTYFEKARAACALIGLGMALTAACSESATEGGTDSNTHWMDTCVSDAECGGLACHCGLCTRECDGAEACVAAGARAECAPSAACGSATGGEVCVLRCDGEGECPGDLRCDGGQCVPGAAKDASVPEGGDGRDGGTDPDAATPFEGCAPMDAQSGPGKCAAPVGVTWDGARCRDVLCDCRGTDCDRLYSSMEECTAARAGCDASDTCELPLDEGNCKAKFNRFGYDPAAGACRPFTYGGCDGNANNFRSLVQCEAACGAPRDAAPPASDCDAMDAGPDGTFCAGIVGYTWDGGRCSPVECGCVGSDCATLYATEADCTAARSTCYAAAGSCELPFETRPCEGSIPRYTYDPVAAGCRGVVFGGCDATANNFVSLEACESACGARADICYLCPGGECGTGPHDDCSACPADRDSSGEGCSVDGLSCFFGPGCGGVTCDCAPGDAGGLVWTCIGNLC